MASFTAFVLSRLGNGLSTVWRAPWAAKLRGGLVAVFGGALLVSLLTYHATDPSLSTASGEKVENLLGGFGAGLADLFIQPLGLSALMLSAFMILFGFRRAADPEPDQGRLFLRLHALGAALATLCVSAALAAPSPPKIWPLAKSLGGFWGAGLLDSVASFLTFMHLPAGISPLVACIVFVALGLWAGAFALQIRKEELQRAAHFTGQAFASLVFFLRELTRKEPRGPRYDDDAHADAPFFDEEALERAKAKKTGKKPKAETKAGQAPYGAPQVEDPAHGFDPNTVDENAPAPANPLSGAMAFADRALSGLKKRPQAHPPLAPETGPAYGTIKLSDEAARAYDPDMRDEMPDEDGAYLSSTPPRDGDPQIRIDAPKVAGISHPKPSEREQRENQGAFEFAKIQGFHLPELAMLTKPSARAFAHDEESLRANAKMLETVLAEFGVRGTIDQIRPGPVVTLYELVPAAGVKSARVMALADDIARSMSARACRVAVVQGRNAIGIELPNQKRETVYLRDLLSSNEYERNGHILPLALGENIGGEPYVADLAKMPHLLIAGTTGSGKSVGVNAMILSILYRLPP